VNDLPPLLSLVDGFSGEWLSLSVNGGASTYLLKDLHAQEIGSEPTPGWSRAAGLGRLAQAHPGPVRSPLRSCGSSYLYALFPLHLHHLDDVILASKMEVLLA
jgi:hypothetical protein